MYKYIGILSIERERKRVVHKKSNDEWLVFDCWLGCHSVTKDSIVFFHVIYTI